MIAIFVIVDSDPLKQSKTWRGIEILSPSVPSNFDWSSSSLVVSSYMADRSLLCRLQKILACQAIKFFGSLILFENIEFSILKRCVWP